jgi:NTP pyrophosphatase (non-canonical NTP hydrolase)
MPFQHAITILERESKYLKLDAEAEVEARNNKAGLESTAFALSNAATFLKVANLGGMSALVSLVRQWGQDRNITGPNAKATVHTQFEKLREEFLELEDAIAREDQHELIDAIGDMTVVLILLSELAGVRFETCLVAAYEEIRDRKGSMINGAFVKQL